MSKSSLLNLLRGLIAGRLGTRAGKSPELIICARLFWLWIALRTAAWVLMATALEANGPLDLVEWLSWGHQWQLGYHKHPPFPAWVAAAFHYLTPGSLAGVYAASYLTIAVALWCGWRLGREMVGPRLALFGVLALDGVTYFTIDGSEFSNNVALNACWAATVLCLYMAIRTDRMRWWISLGAAVGLGLLSKYALGALLVPLLAFTLVRPEGRAIWRRRGVYVAAALALALFAPHLWWLCRNDFVTFDYARDRSFGKKVWWAHLYYPLLFVSGQGYRLVIVCLTLLPLLMRRRRTLSPAQSFDRNFLAWAVLGPVVLLLIASAAFAKPVLEVWGSPLWSFAGLLLLCHFAKDATDADFDKARRVWFTIALAVFAFALGRHFFHADVLGKPMRAHFPGQVLAIDVTQRWTDQHGEPFRVVAGESWIAGNVAVYAPHRPVVYPTRSLGYLDLDEKYARWTSDEELRTRGGVLVWEAAKYGDDLPSDWRRRFPSAEVQPPLLVAYQCRKAFPLLRVGLAFVPPARAP